MGQLASYLQIEFAKHCPAGWRCRHEIPILTRDMERLYGYAPRVDVLLERADEQRRLWIEFEISRADPVANHAKFAAAHLFDPQPETDVFMSMVSAHVTRGRHNLAANMVELMRAAGMRAFQIPLLPAVPGEIIKRLNHSSPKKIADEDLDVTQEIQRIVEISEPVLATTKHHIHFSANIMEVMLNLHRWNLDIATERGRRLWGRRTITYFVHDSRSNCFAPSKFCAYVGIPMDAQRADSSRRSQMTIEFYSGSDGSYPGFDGGRAWTHLAKNLAMEVVEPNDVPDIAREFKRWQEDHGDHVTVHPGGPKFLLAPLWFR